MARTDRASIAGNRRAASCTPYPLFTCVSMHPLSRRRGVLLTFGAVGISSTRVRQVHWLPPLITTSFSASLPGVRDRSGHQYPICRNHIVRIRNTCFRFLFIDLGVIGSPCKLLVLSKLLERR